MSSVPDGYRVALVERGDVAEAEDERPLDLQQQQAGILQQVPSNHVGAEHTGQGDRASCLCTTGNSRNSRSCIIVIHSACR